MKLMLCNDSQPLRITWRNKSAYISTLTADTGQMRITWRNKSAYISTLTMDMECCVMTASLYVSPEGRNHHALALSPWKQNKMWLCVMRASPSKPPTPQRLLCSFNNRHHPSLQHGAGTTNQNKHVNTSIRCILACTHAQTHMHVQKRTHTPTHSPPKQDWCHTDLIAHLPLGGVGLSLLLCTETGKSTWTIPQSTTALHTIHTHTTTVHSVICFSCTTSSILQRLNPLLSLGKVMKHSHCPVNWSQNQSTVFSTKHPNSGTACCYTSATQLPSLL